ncbi:MAG: transglutaminase family protein [Prochloraceae cyanobacterium]|nr:transglutaminase family protein [Prochloraceae cyanobacterium]
MNIFLKNTDIIDWEHVEVLNLAKKLAAETEEEIVKNCFEFVRDKISHSSDYQMNPVTCKASEVLTKKTGYCYAKSHLLGALLRANGIPVGFCYQRLSVYENGEPYCLHGFNAVYLTGIGWYRIDARGNKKGVNAQFTPPKEQLAYSINFPEEVDCKRVFSEPLPIVVKALQTYKSWNELLNNLPDLPATKLREFDSRIEPKYVF